MPFRSFSAVLQFVIDHVARYAFSSKTVNRLEKHPENHIN